MLKNFKYIFIMFTIMTSMNSQANPFGTEYHNMPAHIKEAKLFPEFWHTELGAKEVESYIRYQTMLDDENSPFRTYLSNALPWSKSNHMYGELAGNISEYKDLLKEYDEANGFGKRKIKKQLKTLVLDKFAKNKPFESIKGKKILIKVPVTAGYPFDFERMSKSLIMKSNFCSSADVKEPRISREGHDVNYVQQPLTSPIKLLVQGKRSASCKVELLFGEDEVTAEKVETAFDNGSLQAYALAEFVGYGLSDKPLAIVDSLVFVEERQRTKSDGQLHLTYLTEIKASSTKYTPENILSLVKIDEMIKTDKQMYNWLKDIFSKGVLTGVYGALDVKGIMRLTADNSHIEMLLTKPDGAKTVGAFARYKIVKTQVGYYFELKARTGTNISLSPLLIPKYKFSNKMVSGDYAANQDTVDLKIALKDKRFYAAKNWDDTSLKIGYIEGSEKEFVSTIPLIELSSTENTSNKTEHPAQVKELEKQQAEVKVEALEKVALNNDYKQQCNLKLEDKGGFFNGQHYIGKQTISAPRDYAFARIQEWLVENDQVIGEKIDKDSFASYQIISETKRYTTTIKLQESNLTLEFKTYAGVSIAEKAVRSVWCDMITAI